MRSPLPAEAVPIFHSNPSATAKLFLDVNGRSMATWGGYTNIQVPPFDLVDDAASVYAIWQRVAHDYRQFNVDVTTEDPGNETNRVTAVISIGGAWSDWYMSASGGVAYIGGFTNSSPNVGFVFARSLGNNLKYLADAASHEAGHLFGLNHQALWVNGVLQSEYRGDGPIMGAPYSIPEPFWTIGQTDFGNIQDDVAVIGGTSNGFGFRVLAEQFKCVLDNPQYRGELTVTVAGQQSVHPTIPGQLEVLGLTGNAQDSVTGSFVYVNEAGVRSLVPSTASVVL